MQNGQYLFTNIFQLINVTIKEAYQRSNKNIVKYVKYV